MTEQELKEKIKKEAIVAMNIVRKKYHDAMLIDFVVYKDELIGLCFYSLWHGCNGMWDKKNGIKLFEPKVKRGFFN